MARVVLEHVGKVFRGPKGEEIRAVEEVSFAVEEGELLVLVGPSGCGKTTTLRLIAGLEEVGAGTISIDGKVVNKVAPKDRDIAMVFQNHALYPHMTVFENLAFGLNVRKFSRAEIDRRIQEAVDMLGLGNCLSRRPEELSGGQRQRVALGRAIVLKPRLFLFDEPLSNLDLPMRGQLRAELARLHTKLGATMIYVTHDQVEAMTLGSRIAVMRGGKILQVAEPLTLYRDPANVFVGRFMGSPPMNFFRGMILESDGTLYFQLNAEAPGNFKVALSSPAPQMIKSCVGNEIILGLRPEDISVSALGNAHVIGATIEAVVEIVELLGSEIHLHLNAGRPVIARVSPSIRPRVNERMSLCFDTTKARFFDPATELALG